MESYRQIAIVDPITPDLARNLPPRVLDYIRAREGVETTLAALFADLNNILGSQPSDSLLRAFPPDPGVSEGNDRASGQVVLTMPHGKSELSWCLCRYVPVNRLILPGVPRISLN